MKTKLIGSFLWGLVFAALALTLAPRAAKAQANEIGEFTLPFEVHWGTAVLPAGAYRFSVGYLRPSNMVLVYKKSSPSAGYLIMPHGWNSTPASSGRGQLVFDRKDGEVYAKELQLGSESIALYFGAPKLKKKDVLARSSPPQRGPTEIPSGK
jgi:hypothetical protein